MYVGDKLMSYKNLDNAKEPFGLLPAGAIRSWLDQHHPATYYGEMEYRELLDTFFLNSMADMEAEIKELKEKLRSHGL